MTHSRPTLLCLSGHDPGGGAGVQADIETAVALGVHALTVVTALTVQDSSDVREVEPVPADLIARQLDVMLADFRIDAVKLGLLGGAGQLAVIRAALDRLRVPVVLDPVLRAGGGSDLVAADFPAALLRELAPAVTVMTPNAAEARRLGGAEAVLAAGAEHVLVTGGDEPGERVVNVHHRRGAPPQRHEWPRLPGPFHGAGCTLASAVAAKLARGLAVEAALTEAQAWTHASLARGFAPGRGRPIPGRFA